jgi:hypothetical protein
MSRHTIGTKRGSVRGAPPDVYVGFGEFDETEEAWEPTIRLAKNMGAWVLCMILSAFLFVLMVAFGWLPDDFLD